MVRKLVANQSRVKPLVGFESPSLRYDTKCPRNSADRVPRFEREGREFKSLRGYLECNRIGQAAASNTAASNTAAGNRSEFEPLVFRLTDEIPE